MHKTVTITIGEMLFTIEENAYKRLESYLATIRAHFAKLPEGEEIVSDIESRIAEEFAEALKGRKKVIGEKDVEDVIKSMGTVEDFARFEGDHGGESGAGKEETMGRAGIPWKGKLYRSSDDQMLGGVCAGLAAYAGVDPWIIRLAFFLLTLAHGAGIVVYIVLWIVLPEAKTAAQKVEMAHGQVTLSAIQQKVNEALPKEKRESILRKIVTVPATVIRAVFLAVAKVIGFVVPLLARVAGFAIIIAGALCIAGLSILLITLITNPAAMLDFPLRETIGQLYYMLLAFSAYFVALFPLIIVIMIGSSLLTMRSAFTMGGTSALFVLWCVSLVVAGATAFNVSQDVETAMQKYEQEHFKITTTEFPEYKDFTKVVGMGNSNIVVSQGKAYSVSLEGPENETNILGVADGTLTLHPAVHSRRCFFFCNFAGSTLRITMPALESAEVSGVSSAFVSGFSGGTIILEASGNSSIVASIAPQNLEADIDGVSDIELKGRADTMKAYVSGNATLNAYGFPVKDAELHVDGVSNAMVDATESLTGSADGNATIFYVRDPKTLKVDTSGVSSVERRGDSMREEFVY